MIKWDGANVGDDPPDPGVELFLVMSHMPVKAEAEASASAQGMAPGLNACLMYVSAK